MMKTKATRCLNEACLSRSICKRAEKSENKDQSYMNFKGRNADGVCSYFIRKD